MIEENCYKGSRRTSERHEKNYMKSINKIHALITIRCLSFEGTHYDLCCDQSSWLFAQVRGGMTMLFQTYQKSHKIHKTTRVSLRKWLSNSEQLWPPGDLHFPFVSWMHASWNTDIPLPTTVRENQILCSRPSHLSYTDIPFWLFCVLSW